MGVDVLEVDMHDINGISLLREINWSGPQGIAQYMFVCVYLVENNNHLRFFLNLGHKKSGIICSFSCILEEKWTNVSTSILLF